MCPDGLVYNLEIEGTHTYLANGIVVHNCHEAAEIARDFMGFSVSRFVIDKLTRWLKGLSQGLYKEVAQRFGGVNERFFATIKEIATGPLYNVRLRMPGWDNGAHAELLPWLDYCAEMALVNIRSQDITSAEKSDAVQAYNIATRTKSRLLNCVGLSESNMVYWLELTKAGNALIKAKPIDVHHTLNQELFGKVRSAVMTSATLSTSGNFEFIRGELGVPEDALESIVESPFDFNEQALLVVPNNAPDPKSPDFARGCADIISQVMETCDGRTLCLFTSNKNLKAAHDIVSRKRLPYPLLRQGGRMQRMELYTRFREQPRSVLFGVASFWTGIDVPGDALIGLVIDKLPFPNMSDPFVDAIKSKWPNSFGRYSIPRAIITLKQGMGRLIRRKDDYGVIVIADRRLVEHPKYSRQFLLSMPPFSSTRDMADIRPFIEGHRAKHSDVTSSGSLNSDQQQLEREWIIYLEGVRDVLLGAPEPQRREAMLKALRQDMAEAVGMGKINLGAAIHKVELDANLLALFLRMHKAECRRVQKTASA